jgi:hypothetical protein
MVLFRMIATGKIYGCRAGWCGSVFIAEPPKGRCQLKLTGGSRTRRVRLSLPYPIKQKGGVKKWIW